MLQTDAKTMAATSLVLKSTVVVVLLGASC